MLADEEGLAHGATSTLPTGPNGHQSEREISVPSRNVVSVITGTSFLE